MRSTWLVVAGLLVVGACSSASGTHAAAPTTVARSAITNTSLSTSTTLAPTTTTFDVAGPIIVRHLEWLKTTLVVGVELAKSPTRTTCLAAQTELAARPAAPTFAEMSIVIPDPAEGPTVKVIYDNLETDVSGAVSQCLRGSFNWTVLLQDIPSQTAGLSGNIPDRYLAQVIVPSLTAAAQRAKQ